MDRATDVAAAGSQSVRPDERAELIRELRRRLNDLTRLVSDWVWETDRNLQLTFVSERGFDLLGIVPQEMTGRRLQDLGTFLSRDGTSTQPNWRAPFRDWPFRMRDKQGDERVFLVSALPMFHPDTGRFEGIRGTARDITERGRTERALERSEDRFRRVFVNGGAKRDHLGGVRRDRLAAAGLSP